MGSQLVTALISMGLLGTAFGLGLSWASRRFAVDVDEKVEAVEQIIPGANCGACGYSGCHAFAEALVAGEAEVNGCPVGGKEFAEKAARILGLEFASGGETRVAQLRCHGDCDVARKRAEYDGVQDCNAAVLAGNGPKACESGCLGFGTCAASCPFGAITMSDKGLPVVDEDKCTGCGVCVRLCPRNLFRLEPKTAGVHVRCASTAAGKRVRQVCDVGCIGCRQCEKACRFDAIHVENDLAVIDPEKCINCGACVRACPVGAIEKQDDKPVRKPPRKPTEEKQQPREAAVK